MASHRPLLRLLALAIVMIAASFAPTLAEAHAGHGTEPRQAVAATLVAAELPVVAVTGDSLSRAADPARVEGTFVRSAAGVPSGATACSGLCCGIGSACCSLATLPVAAGLWLPASRRCGAAWMRDPAHPGVIPEALPEPPRSFA